ncbi:ABC transporter ATP-binding protein [Cellulosimicrobium sp. XJ-DQ-B-000]|uniref:ABC transporter ATP-binding protein n=1 Tax=Cellulosimicrobium sp. XJ-DQ-B-000 TaxID=3072182 RepID=UPI00280A16DF|nr:ABC transporter ATP-binding protein [Cellulosimicrobium sp. XJ-DQ-B-000]MDQ8042038.1 ABC transporter ATP-binding protein [Cellulosimicrobium sp. XJ-DQ-B-000]
MSEDRHEGRPPLRHRVRRWTTMWGLLRHAGLPIVAAGLALSLLLAVLPLATIVLLGRVLFLLPDVTSRPGGWGELLGVLGLAVAALVVQQGLAPFQAGVVETIGRRVDQRCIDRLLTAALSDAPLALLDDPEVLDVVADARAAFARQSRSPGDAASALVPLVGRYVQLVGASVLVAVVVSPLAGALILATALAIRTGVRGTLGRFGPVWDSLAPLRRRQSYLRDLATTPSITKEVRLLGLLPWLRGRLHDDTMAFLEPQWASSRRLQLWPFVGFSAIGLVGGAAVLVLVALDAATLDLFALGVALQAVLIPMRFGVYFPECDVQTQFGLQSFDALARFEERLASGDAPEAADGDRAVPRGVIRFEDVWFRYRDDAAWVLRGLDVELVPGTSTAIVGLNGAGKTTTIKLLARLYEPTRGRITVDGVDVRDLPLDAWRARLALIFQDYVRLELPAADNVALGAPALRDDDARLREAVAAAGADAVVAGLGDGLGTVLSGGYAGGRDLSGGQWQRIALARALLAVSGGADVLVLDEPTAQLDVRAEAEFFERFLAQGAVDAVAAGRPVTSVVISHRFSTVRPADRIVVVAEGRVVEQGTHDELLALDGRYAELFLLQARRFRTDPLPTPTAGGAL